MIEVFVPKLKVQTIYDIPLDELYANGIRGIITDLDNTLVSQKTVSATKELVSWLDKVRKLGLDVVIVSNNNESRVGAFASPLNIPYIFKAKKPTQGAFARAIKILDLQPSEIVMIGDQMMTDVYGGNKMGLHTILVKSIAPHEEGMGTKINRQLERIAIRRLRKRGLWLEEE